MWVNFIQLLATDYLTDMIESDIISSLIRKWIFSESYLLSIKYIEIFLSYFDCLIEHLMFDFMIYFLQAVSKLNSIIQLGDRKFLL